VRSLLVRENLGTVLVAVAAAVRHPLGDVRGPLLPRRRLGVGHDRRSGRPPRRGRPGGRRAAAAHRSRRPAAGRSPMTTPRDRSPVHRPAGAPR
jgi:hypothetical protein